MKYNLPTSSFPKPGEEVTWFSSFTKVEGKLLGYDIDEQPIIINNFGSPDRTNSFDVIRPKDPYARIGPNWERLPTGGIIISADAELAEKIQEKLDERMPPGPSYLELIGEIFFRGYEVYLVGGTVRDYVQGDKSNDIDLVTTMPLKSAQPLIESMYNDKYSYKKENGFIRIGGKPSSGDPFIDLKNFTLSNSGIAKFGSDIECDLKTRDFACNSLYYDAINCNIIDPSGIGYQDAKAKNLSLVKDEAFNTPHYQSAQILIRLIKFAARGYNCTEECIQQIRENFLGHFSTFDTNSRMRYIRSQILNKQPDDKKQDAFNEFVAKMIDLGFEREYLKYIKPFEHLLGLRNGNR